MPAACRCTGRHTSPRMWPLHASTCTHRASSAQIVGLKSGWHAAAVMGTSQFHGLRLAHAAEMRLELLAHGTAPRLLLSWAPSFCLVCVPLGV